ncbi:MAG: hypothetical protein KDA44_22050, partial [Planctomycetales bacterium]|nr:hypothetical protein [Planctomycetales bacterium]
MDTASLLISACALAVQAGWQPAENAPQTYEYSLAIDAQTAAKLAAGDDVELAVDVPQDLQRISRIRLVAGEEAPPRQRRVTALKPPLPDGVKLTQQYQPTTTADQRYAAGGTASPAGFDPYSPTQPSGAQPFTGAAPRYPGAPGSSTWPAAPASAAATSAPPAYGQGVGDYAQGVANQFGQAAGQTATQWQTAAENQFNAGVQRTATPVRDAFGRIDDRFRTAFENLGDRSREVLQGATPQLSGQGMYSAATPTSAATQPLGPPWAPPLVQTTPTTGNSNWTTPAAGSSATTPALANPWGQQPPAVGNAPTPAGAWPTSPQFVGGGSQPAPAVAATNASWPYPGGGQPTPAAVDPRQAYPNGYAQPAPTSTPARERIDRPIEPQDAGRWYGATQPSQPATQPQGPIVEVADQRYAGGNTTTANGGAAGGATAASAWPGQAAATGGTTPTAAQPTRPGWETGPTTTTAGGPGAAPGSSTNW